MLDGMAVNSGAGNVVLLTRSGATKRLVQELIQKMAQLGANIDVCDVSNKQDLLRVPEDCKKCLPPIRGFVVVHRSRDSGATTSIVSSIPQSPFAKIQNHERRKFTQRT